MIPFVARATACALFLAPALASAQTHAHSHAAPNGGQIQKIGIYEAELVVKGGEVALYVTDADDKKVAAAPLSATALVLAKGNEQKSIDLKPAGDNKLGGRIDFPFEGKFRATVTLRTASGEAGKARYSLDAK